VKTRLFAFWLILVAALCFACPRAMAEDMLDEYLVTAAVNEDGSMNVRVYIRTQITGPVQQTFALKKEIADRRDYVYTLTDFKVTVPGESEPTEPLQVASDGETLTVTLDQPLDDNAREFSYTVLGAATRAADGATVVSWDFVQGIALPIDIVEADVDVPGQFTSIDCEAGHPDSPGSCTYYCGGTSDCPVPKFHDEGVLAGEVVRATLRFPAKNVAVNQVIAEHWMFERAFSVEPLQLGVAIGVLVLGAGALWLAHRSHGSDASSEGGIRVAEFHPVAEGRTEFRVLDNARPGLVGTVLDERVDPIDITATLLDLAARGHVRIEELPRETPHSPTDWSFTRISTDVESLRPYERTLLDAIAPAEAEPVLVSDLVEHIHPVVGTVQSQLYDEVVARDWFARRPDSTRNVWGRVGWFAIGLAVLATILLACLTTFGLTGLALVVLALGVLFVAQEMPARTAKGTGVLWGLRLLAATLESQPTDQLPADQEIEQVSAILPYAVVLGGWERWLDALAALDFDEAEDPTEVYWYHAPAGWQLRHLPASLRNFVTTVQGTLFTR
jgi:hypothetical protein